MGKQAWAVLLKEVMTFGAPRPPRTPGEREPRPLAGHLRPRSALRPPTPGLACPTTASSPDGGGTPAGEGETERGPGYPQAEKQGKKVPWALSRAAKPGVKHVSLGTGSRRLQAHDHSLWELSPEEGQHSMGTRSPRPPHSPWRCPSRGSPESLPSQQVPLAVPAGH